MNFSYSWSSISLQQKIRYSLAFSIAIIMLLMSLHFGITGDAIDMKNLGELIWRYLSSFGADKLVLDIPKELDRDGVLKYYGGFFDLLAFLLTKISPFGLWTTRHLLNAFFGFLAIWYSSKIALSIYGEKASILVMILMFFFPFYMGHAMNNPKDVPFAALYVISIYRIHRFFQQIETLKPLDYFWVILSISLAINVRVAGILLVVYIPIYALFIGFTRKQLTWGLSQWKPMVLVMILAYFLASLLWPFALQNPLSNPIEALKALSNFKVNLAQLYEGVKTPSNQLPRTFLLQAIYLTSTIPYLIGYVLMVLFIYNRFTWLKSNALLLFVGFACFFPLAYIMYQHANVYHLWRHILFIFPPLSILVAVSWISFIETQSVKFQRIAFLVLVLGFIEVIYFQITTFPHIASYFNPISGGLKKNYDLHETDYYYNSLKPAVDWFLKNEYPKYAKSDTIVVASNAQHILNEYFKAHGNIKTAYVRYAERFNTPTNYAFFHRSLIPEQDLTEKHWIRDPQIVYISGVDSAVFSIILHYADSGLFRGIAAINDNKFAIALPELMRYHAKYPKDFASLKYLGIAFTQLGQPDSGLKYLRASIEIKDDLQSRLFYGLNLLNKNDIVNGISVLEQIVLVTPTTSEQANVILQSLQMLIQVYRSTGNMAKANEYQNLLAQYQQMMSSSQ